MIIKVTDTGIEIKVNNADEMYKIFFRLNGWMDLEIGEDKYPCTSGMVGYTRGYFQAKYFC